MIDLVKKNAGLYALYLLLLLAGSIVCLTYGKLDIALSVNALHAPWADVFFKYLTNLGSFAVIGPVLLALVFIRYRHALAAAVSSLAGFLMVQFAKRVIWYDAPRPAVFFKDLPDIHYVAGVHLHHAHSFPSGHTEGAFALFFALALMPQKWGMKLIWLLLALLTGYSRMYLSQHFLVDVLAGSFLGVLSATLSWWWFNRPEQRSKAALDGSLLQTLRRR